MLQILSRFTASSTIYHLNLSFPLRLNTFIKKVNSLSSDNPALFVSFNGPIQSLQTAATIRDSLRFVSKHKHLPIHSFLNNNINGLTYYAACASKNIYANPFCLMGDITTPTKSYTNIHKLLKLLGVQVQKIGNLRTIWDPVAAANQHQKQFTKKWLNQLSQKLASTIQKQRQISRQAIKQFGNKLIHPKRALQLQLISKITTINQLQATVFPNGKIVDVNFGNQQKRVAFKPNQLNILTQISLWIEQPQSVMMAMEDPMNNLAKSFIEIVSARLQNPQELQQLEIICQKLLNKLQTNLKQSQTIII